MKQLGPRLKQARKATRLTQSELAMRCGYNSTSFTMISLYETGHRIPDLTQLIKLADALNVSLDYLTGRADSVKLTLQKKQALGLPRVSKEIPCK